MPDEYDENDEKSLEIAKAAIEKNFSDNEAGGIVQSCGGKNTPDTTDFNSKLQNLKIDSQDIDKITRQLGSSQVGKDIKSFINKGNFDDASGYKDLLL